MATILVIEDEAPLRSDIAEVLGEAGHRTIEAANGLDGLRAILANPPDLVVSDITMPVMNGYDLLSRLREEHPELAELPFVFLSALADRRHVIAGKALGADDYLVKPVDHDLLLATVDARLRQVARVRKKHEAERDAAKRQFMALINHELRTPLNAIIGLSELMTGEVFGDIGNERYRTYLQDIHASGLRLNDLLRDILAIVDTIEGRVELMEETVDAGELARGVVAMVRHRADTARQHIELAVAGTVRFRGDSRLVKQALLQVLSNAIRFTPEGGTVSLAVGRESAGAVFLRVRDSGPGIPTAELPRLMKPFVQGDTSLARRHEGAGIGLPLARSFMELHGGTLDIDSAPGRGTVVTLRLPAGRSLPEDRGSAGAGGEKPVSNAA